MRCPSRASSTIATSRTNIRIACLIETVCRAVLSVLRTTTRDIRPTSLLGPRVHKPTTTLYWDYGGLGQDRAISNACVSVVLTMLECMFDYERVSSQPTPSRIHELQQRVQRMQGSAFSRTLESVPGLSGVIQLRTGEAYAVDSPSLAVALAAGPSQAGEWIAIVGAPDLGLEAAAGFGIDLERTVAVPHPGELWMSVTAGLLDVATLVIVKPSVPVSAQQAERLKSRLRVKDAALVCWGEWPRSDATLTITESSWLGLGRGHGRLAARQVVVSIRQGGPVRRVLLWLPGLDQQVAERNHTVVQLAVA